jgi:peroxisomal 3,2-trans-enoyl-CoA isomerase
MTTKAKHSTASTSPILTHKQDGVTTLTMNTPARLNGWTKEMMDALKEGLNAAARDDET